MKVCQNGITQCYTMKLINAAHQKVVSDHWPKYLEYFLNLKQLCKYISFCSSDWLEKNKLCHRAYVFPKLKDSSMYWIAIIINLVDFEVLYDPLKLWQSGPPPASQITISWLIVNSRDKINVIIEILTPTFLLHKSMAKLLLQKLNLLSLNLNRWLWVLKRNIPLCSTFKSMQHHTDNFICKQRHDKFRLLLG